MRGGFAKFCSDAMNLSSPIVISSLTRWLVIFIIALPIIAGIAVTVSIAFGYFPALGGERLTLKHFEALTQHPGFWQIAWRTLKIGFAATVASVALTYLFLIFLLSKPVVLHWVRMCISPILAIPHIAAAIGIIYLFSASGIMGRVLHQMFDTHVDYIFAPDPYGIAMILALVSKEVPYLLLIALGILAQIPMDKILAVARTLGYTRPSAWLKVILPRVHQQMLLPILIILSFSLTSTEHNLLLLPRYATGLPGLIVDFYHHPDLSTQFLASCAICALVLLCLFSIGVWLFLSFIAEKLFGQLTTNGKRYIPYAYGLEKLCLIIIILLFGFHIGALLVLMVWSFTYSWFYPHFTPDAFTFQYWADAGLYIDATLCTLLLAFCSIIISLALSIAYLEAKKAKPKEKYQPRSSSQRCPLGLFSYQASSLADKVFTALIYLPLIIPQVGFVFGLKFLFSFFDAHYLHFFFAVVWGHVLFVFPYCFLSIFAPYQKFDRRLMMVGRTLGRSRLYTTLKIKWPLLKAPIFFGCAIGISVSFSLYLPTLILGGGRLQTLTVETIALASGGNLRFIALLVVLQTGISFFVFFMAILAAKNKNILNLNIQQK